MIFDDNCLFLHKNLCCGCSLESPRRGNSKEHPQHRFGEAFLMSTHNIGFYEDVTKLSFNYYQICTLTLLLTTALSVESPKPVLR